MFMFNTLTISNISYNADMAEAVSTTAAGRSGTYQEIPTKFAAFGPQNALQYKS